MANILARFKDVMAANVNALLEKAEDPEKMIAQYLRNLETDLGRVKSETAAVMAEESSAKRKYDECAEEIARMDAYARKAVAAGNDGEAKKFLQKKNQLIEEQTALKDRYDAAAANAAKMKEMHNKLTEDIDGLKARRDILKSKLAVARTREKLNGLGEGMDSAGGNIAAFDAMEEKVNGMLDKSEAMARLNGGEKEDSIETLSAKYDVQEKAGAVDEELAKLKKEMGL